MLPDITCYVSIPSQQVMFKLTSPIDVIGDISLIMHWDLPTPA